MEKRLPVPIFLNDKLYTKIDFKKPTGGVLVETKNTSENSSAYLAMRDFIAGCTESIYDDNDNVITDKVSLKSMLNKLSIKSAEYICQEIMIHYYDGEDYVEGIYYCPFCGTKSVARKTDDVDTRDRISDLEVNFSKEKVEDIYVEFQSPLEIEVKDDIFFIENITVKIPTLENHHNVYMRHGDANLVKYQLEVYADCITKINGVDVENFWKKSFNTKIFNETDEIRYITDILGENINCYGVDPRVEKFCKKCGEVWQPVINTSNFFGSALQLI